jgi:hypothetical protein
MVEMTPSFNCIRCGEPFLRGRLGRPALYCSANCRTRQYEDRRALGLLAPLLEQATAQRNKAARGETSRTESRSDATDE